MKILIAGAHGTTGKQIVELLSETDKHESYAMIRKEEQAAEMKKLGADHVVVANLEGDVSETTKGMDAVIFAAGSKGKNVEGVDQKGAEKLVDAAKAAGVSHFVMLSAYGVDDPRGELKEYLEAKAKADQHLLDSGLPYTIVRPGHLGNDAPTGKVKTADHFSSAGDSKIPRADVAHVLVKSLEVENARNKTFELLTGNTPIQEALKQI
ncbi:SDR family oxidoreductase [Pontibacter actiniarum]|uniref:NAD-dependent dehydratase n=1 Tax=Pontibacter actiniarum TaxID=323450 RepID=A0A1X9YTE4_9BACT|nr:SDR family oxidoreductase [Pontibacter actiniarum]ARS36133.1 NAD-dependent dehydratase [Pontibacter actiniarum]